MFNESHTIYKYILRMICVVSPIFGFKRVLKETSQGLLDYLKSTPPEFILWWVFHERYMIFATYLYWMICLYTQMLHGAGVLTYIHLQNGPNVGEYSSTMEHLGYLEISTSIWYNIFLFCSGSKIAQEISGIWPDHSTKVSILASPHSWGN